MYRIHKISLSSEHEEQEESAGEVALAPAETKLKPPSRYRVVLLNDDYTTMEFVVEVLEKFFSMSREKATTIMLEVHTRGRAVCGIYTKDVAETKVEQVLQYAREEEHPLLCKAEKMD